MKYHRKDVSQYIELAWDKRTNIIVHDFIFLLLVWLNLHNIVIGINRTSYFYFVDKSIFLFCFLW